MIRRSLACARWEPVLRDQAASRAHAILDELAHALRGGWGTDANTPSALCDKALFFAVYARYFQSPHDLTLSAQLVQAAVDALETPAAASVSVGELAPLGWTMEYLARLVSVDPSEITDTIDNVLYQHAPRFGATRTFDLQGGLSAVALFGTELARNGRTSMCLPRAVGALVAGFVSIDGGASWPAREGQRIPMPDGSMHECLYDLGLAHGVPGILAALVSVFEFSEVDDRTLDIVRRVIRWVFAQRNRCAGSNFPAAMTVAGEILPAQSVAWCYGDASVALVLLRAADFIEDARARAEAVESALASVEFNHANDDPSLCHGAAAAAHVFARLFQRTGRAAFHDAAARWFTRLMDQHGQDGLDGFEVWQAKRGKRTRVRHDGLLAGAAGIGLALLAGVSTTDPDWDRRLGLSS